MSTTNIQSQYTSLASQALVDETVASLSKKHLLPIVVKSKEEALEKIKEIIPAGASVMNGASVSLEQIGYMNYLNNGQHQWRDLHAEIRAENDEKKRHHLRQQSSLSDFYLGSVHALIKDGQMIIASNSGSQLPHLAFTSPNIILVVSTKKIVTTLSDGMKRLEDYVVPLEDKHMKELGMGGTMLSKILIFKNEPPFLGRKIHIILVEENLGF